MHVEDPADLQDGGLGGSNLEHMHPTKQRVWVLLGGDGPQRSQSLQAGLHAYLRCGGGWGGVLRREGGAGKGVLPRQSDHVAHSARAVCSLERTAPGECDMLTTSSCPALPFCCSLRQHPELLVEGYLLEPNAAGTECVHPAAAAAAAAAAATCECGGGFALFCSLQACLAHASCACS